MEMSLVQAREMWPSLIVLSSRSELHQKSAMTAWCSDHEATCRTASDLVPEAT